MSQIDKLIPLLNYVYQTKELLQNPSLKKCVRKKDLTQILKELNAFDELCQQYMYGVRSRTEGHAEVTAAVVGDFSSGKSSFINALLGSEICPVDQAPTTSSITYFSHGPDNTIEIKEEDGRRDVSPEEYAKLVKHSKDGPSQGFEFYVRRPFKQLQFLRLVDTPGFSNPKNPQDAKLTMETVNSADLLIVVMDAAKGSLNSELVGRIKKMKGADNKRTYLLVNKADLVKNPKKREQIRAKILKLYPDMFDRVEFVSSKNLSQGNEQDSTQRLEALFTQVEAAIADRSDFNIVLSGGQDQSKRRPKYELHLGEETVSLKNLDLDGVVSRKDLLGLLEDVREHREELLSRQLVSGYGALQKQSRTLNLNIQKFCTKAKEQVQLKGLNANVNQISQEEIVQQLDVLTEEVCDILLMELCPIYEHNVQSSSWTDEGFIWDTKHYTIQCRPRYFWQQIASLSCWNDVELKILEHFETIEEEAPDIDIMNFDSEEYVNLLIAKMRVDLTDEALDEDSESWWVDCQDPWVQAIFHIFHHDGEGKVNVYSDIDKSDRNATQRSLKSGLREYAEATIGAMLRELFLPELEAYKQRILFELGKSQGNQEGTQSHMLENLEQMSSLGKKIEGVLK